jgi:hypothetical protein
VTINGPLPGRLDRLGLEVRGCLLSNRLVGRLSYDSPLRGSPTRESRRDPSRLYVSVLEPSELEGLGGTLTTSPRSVGYGLGIGEGDIGYVGRGSPVL